MSCFCSAPRGFTFGGILGLLIIGGTVRGLRRLGRLAMVGVVGIGGFAIRS